MASRLTAAGTAPGWALTRAVIDLLDRLTGGAVQGGWSPSELANAVARVVGEGYETVVAWLLGRRQRGAVDSAAQKMGAAALGQPRALHVESIEDLALALRLAALLLDVARLGAPPRWRQATAADPADLRASGQLAKVRALLAKAEATTFAEEAEALSAKAQELISKHSLEQLLRHDANRATDARPSTTYRRLWLDAPYVDAKAKLVDEIAAANRCRSVYAQPLGLLHRHRLAVRPGCGRPDADLHARPGPSCDAAAWVTHLWRALPDPVVPAVFSAVVCHPHRQAAT